MKRAIRLPERSENDGSGERTPTEKRNEKFKADRKYAPWPRRLEGVPGFRDYELIN